MGGRRPDPAREGVRHMKHANIKLILAPLVLIALGILLWSFGGQLHGIMVQAKAWTAEQGPWAWAAFLLIFIVFSCLTIPDSLFCIAAGAIFGFLGGVGVVLAGAALARMAQYVLARRILKARVQRYVSARRRVSSVAQAVLRDQLRLQFMIRLTPMSYTLGSYLFGSIGVGFGKYMLALFGTLPSLLVMVYLGAESAHVTEMGARSGDIAAVDVLKIAGLAVSAIVLVTITKVAIREVRLAVGEADDPAE